MGSAETEGKGGMMVLLKRDEQSLDEAIIVDLVQLSAVDGFEFWTPAMIADIRRRLADTGLAFGYGFMFAADERALRRWYTSLS